MARRKSKASIDTIRRVLNDESVASFREVPSVLPVLPEKRNLHQPSRVLREVHTPVRRLRVSPHEGTATLPIRKKGARSARAYEVRSVIGAPRNLGQKVGHLRCKVKKKSYNAMNVFSGFKLGKGSRKAKRRNAPPRDRRQFC